jgi:hypothetical protein
VPIYQGDVGVVVQCDTAGAFAKDITRVTVLLETPSGVVLTRRGAVSDSVVYWDSGNDLTEAGTYTIAFEIVTPNITHKTDNRSFEVHESVDQHVDEFCPKCNGQGWTRTSPEPSITVACPQCDGQGTVVKEELCSEMQDLAEHFAKKLK